MGRADRLFQTARAPAISATISQGRQLRWVSRISARGHTSWSTLADDKAGTITRAPGQASRQRDCRRVGSRGRIGDCSTNPPADPDVRISLIRFLGVARFHTTRLQPPPQPASLSPSANNQHGFSSDAATRRNVPPLHPGLHDLGARQSILCHHPSKRLPGQLAATATV